MSQENAKIVRRVLGAQIAEVRRFAYPSNYVVSSFSVGRLRGCLASTLSKRVEAVEKQPFRIGADHKHGPDNRACGNVRPLRPVVLNEVREITDRLQKL